MTCGACSRKVPEGSRFCIYCGASLRAGSARSRAGEDLHLPILYAMVVALVIAVVFPPWESPAGEPPEFLGFHFILDVPTSTRGGTGIVSRLLLTVEVMTIGVAGLYFAWLFRGKGR